MNDTNTLPPTIAAMHILTSEGTAILATTTGLLVTVIVTNLEIKKQALYLVLWVYKGYLPPTQLTLSSRTSSMLDQKGWLPSVPECPYQSQVTLSI